jgi:hypothetical protein
MEDMYTPLKIWQVVLEDLGPIMSELASLPQENQAKQSRTTVMERIKRGPTLMLMTPEEKQKMFQD